MPHLILAPSGRRGLERCRRFLAARNEAASERASEAIVASLAKLTVHPQIGRPALSDRSLRELVVPFGSTGYVVLYRHDRETDAIHILAFRHQREADYRD